MPSLPQDSESHFSHLKKLLEIEEAEEIARFRESFLDVTPEQREKMGKALLRMKLSEFHYSGGGHRLATLHYVDGKPLPVYSPDVGDLVTLTEGPHQFPEGPLGTVYDKERGKITLALREKIPEWLVEGGIYDLNIAGSRTTYKKMHEVLKQVRSAKDSRIAYFRDISLGLKQPESYDPLDPSKISYFNSSLNEWQKKTVAKSLAARDVALIHGPPGTGKTTVLIEVMRQTIDQGKFVFATAPSNTACDQLLECLCRAGVPALRLGHPARIMNHLKQHTLDFKLASHPLAETADDLEARLERLLRQKQRSLARGHTSRSEKRERFEEITQLKSEIRELDKQIFSQVVESAPVMVGTPVSSDETFLRKRPIDLLVMDEATQAIEPLAWMTLLRAEKVILAGDHFQLPPTVISKEAEKRGFGKTLFERLHAWVGEEWKSLLRVQYRMNEKIMAFSSGQFYGNQLIADPSVKNHSLSDLPGIQAVEETREVFLFLDTAGRGFEEKLEAGSESRYNPEEAELVVQKLNRLLELGVNPEGIAVISPYSGQVRLLSSMIHDRRIEIDSVDGFQGREKEVVILSLVRSNYEGEMGFLTDTRRMNVAMTRAKRKLMMIGDSGTLAQIPFYKALIEYAESIGGYRTVWEEGG